MTQMELPASAVENLKQTIGKKVAAKAQTLSKEDQKKEKKALAAYKQYVADTENALRIVYLLNFKDPKSEVGATFAQELGGLQHNDGFLSGNVQKTPQGEIANQLIEMLGMSDDILNLKATYENQDRWDENFAFSAFSSPLDASKESAAPCVLDPSKPQTYTIVSISLSLIFLFPL